MGLRFRKSFKILPGVKINFNKNSTSITFGDKGVHYTVNSKGKRTGTFGIPGTGIYYTTSSSSRRKAKSNTPASSKSSPISYKTLFYGFLGCFLLVGVASGFGTKQPVKSTQTNSQEIVSPTIELNEYAPSEVSLVVGDSYETSFMIRPTSVDKNNIDIVNSNNSVVDCSITDIHLACGKVVTTVICHALSPGNAELYCTLKDEDIKSEPIILTVSNSK